MSQATNNIQRTYNGSDEITTHPCQGCIEGNQGQQKVVRISNDKHSTGPTRFELAANALLSTFLKVSKTFVFVKSALL
jgi:hypothetical protein